jgi:hypothetical protein
MLSLLQSRWFLAEEAAEQAGKLLLELPSMAEQAGAQVDILALLSMLLT